MAKQSFNEQLAVQLRRRRAALLREVAETEQEVNAVTNQRESEAEENAQIDRITTLMGRLNGRDLRMIREINEALERIAGGRYGKCVACGAAIGKSRLQALPTAKLCIDCATAQEGREGRKERQAAASDESSAEFPINQIERPPWFQNEETE